MLPADLSIVIHGSMTRRRVLVTAVGLITPLGTTTASTWASLIAHKTGITPHESHHPPQLAALVPPHQPPSSALPGSPPACKFALHAAAEALSQVPQPPVSTGLSIGAALPHLPTVISASSLPTRRVSPFLIPRLLPNTPAGLVSLAHNLQGPCLTPASACTAGLHAVGDGYYAILRGDTDAMLVGASEAPIHDTVIAGFSRAGALTNSASPSASRPFDVKRDGFVIAEGAAVMLLEEESRVRERQGAAYAQITGFGMSCDAHHITSPTPNGNGAQRAMQAALDDASREPNHVDYVNAHATSTKLGDVIERLAVAKVLQSNCSALVSSTKGATGHLLGAAGALEAAFAVLAVAEGVVPPTLNLQSVDQHPVIDDLGWGSVDRYCPQAVERDVSVALSNSFGFGGTNACVVVEKVPNGIQQKRVCQP